MRSCGPTSGQLRPKSSRRRPIPARSLANICRISVATAKASVEAWPSLGPRPLRWKSPELARDRANMKQDSVESRHWAPIPPNLWRVRLTLGGCSSTMSPPFLSRTACRSRLRAPMTHPAMAAPLNRTFRLASFAHQPAVEALRIRTSPGCAALSSTRSSQSAVWPANRASMRTALKRNESALLEARIAALVEDKPGGNLQDMLASRCQP